jgi:hypothetical protein
VCRYLVFEVRKGKLHCSLCCGNPEHLREAGENRSGGES